MPGVIVLLIVLAIAFAFYYGARETEKVNGLWGRAAQELGLTLDPAKGFSARPVLRGVIRGVQVRVDVRNTGGENDTNYTRYRVHHAPVGPDLSLRKQGVLSFMGRLIGRSDVIVGDPLFDDRVVVDSSSPEEVRAFLTPTRRAAVLDLFANWPSGEFTEDGVTIESRNIEKNPQQLVGTVNRLVEIAEVMGAEDLDHALSAQADGNLGEAVRQLHEFNQTHDNAFTRTLEAGALVEQGRHREAAAVLGEAEANHAASDSMTGWHQVAQTPPPPPPPQTPAQARPIAASPAVELGQQAVIDDLFAPERMSWQMVEHFEATYHGEAVRWQGELTGVHSYLHDLDFGAGPGVKATVLLGVVGHSEFISNEVHAVVQFPEEFEAELGAVVGFDGVLAGVDRFSRKVVVLHGQPIA